MSINGHSRAEILCLKRNSSGHLNLSTDYVELQMCCKIISAQKNAPILSSLKTVTGI